MVAKGQERLHCSQSQGCRWQPGGQGPRGIFRITLVNTAWRRWILMVMYTQVSCVVTWVVTVHFCGVKLLSSYLLDCSLICMEHNRCGVSSSIFPRFSSGMGGFFGSHLTSLSISAHSDQVSQLNLSINTARMGRYWMNSWFHLPNPGLPTHHQPQLVLECEIIDPALEVSF